MIIEEFEIIKDKITRKRVLVKRNSDGHKNIDEIEFSHGEENSKIIKLNIVFV